MKIPMSFSLPLLAALVSFAVFSGAYVALWMWTRTP